MSIGLRGQVLRGFIKGGFTGVVHRPNHALQRTGSLRTRSAKGAELASALVPSLCPAAERQR